MKALEYTDILREILPSLPFELKWSDSLTVPFEAFTNITDWRITVQINPEFRKQIGDEKISLLIYTLLKHEEGHWKICPYDGLDHLNIRASVNKALKNNVNKASTEKANALCGLVVNMFEDMIVDKVLIEGNANYKSGIEVILDNYKNLGSEYKSTLSDIMFSLREGFLLGMFVDKKMTDILTTLKGDLLDKQAWIKKSYEFAVKVFKLLNIENALEPLDKEDIIEISKRLTSESIQERRLNEDEQYREEMVKEYFRKMPEKGMGGLNDPLGDSLESLDLYYQSRLEDIRLEYYRKDRKLYPLSYFGKRKLPDKGSLPIGRIKWSATKIINRAQDESIFLYEKETPYSIEGGTEEGKIFFDLALILDSSGSMGSVYKPDHPYSILVTAVYSLFHYLSTSNKDIYMNYCIVNFSSQNWYSGWHDHSVIKMLRREFILKQQGGGTSLKGITVKKMLREAKGQFLAIMVTDGALKTPEEPARAISDLVLQGNKFCLIKIGEYGDEFTKLVKKAGADVHIINKASDLSGLILKKGETYW